MIHLYSLLSRDGRCLPYQIRACQQYVVGLESITVTQGPIGRNPQCSGGPVAMREDIAKTEGIRVLDVPPDSLGQSRVYRILWLYDWILTKLIPQQTEPVALVLAGDVLPVEPVSAAVMKDKRWAMRGGCGFQLGWLMLQRDASMSVADLRRFGDYTGYGSRVYREDDHVEWFDPCWLHLDNLSAGQMTDRKIKLAQQFIPEAARLQWCYDRPDAPVVRMKPRAPGVRPVTLRPKSAPAPPPDAELERRDMARHPTPPLRRRFTNWRTAIQRWKAAGKPERTDEEVEQINGICRACEYYDEKWQQCKLCGCFCRARGRAEFNKPKMATESCPKGKWGLEPIDVVYPLSTGRHGRKILGSKWGNNELRYSLRSLEQYFPRLGRVFIVTETLPSWLKGVEHVKMKDSHRRNKDANLIDKVLAACKAGVSETFIRLSDDQCLLRYWDGEGVWHMGDANGHRGGKWWRRCQNTCNYLKSQNRPTWFYDCHCPAPVDRDAFIEIAEEAPYKEHPGMCINTLYYNSVDIPRERMNGQKVAVHRNIGPKRLRRLAAGKLFLGYSEAGLNKWLKRFLRRRFPRKSRFEK